jgi:serine O-acetyltransferase
MRNPATLQRLAARLAALHVPYLPSCIEGLTRIVYSCVLPHTVRLGNNVRFGYGGLGCVIHGEACIGNDVEIGANVLVGGNATEHGVPIIEDGVYIGFGAVIIGPIRIGHGAVVGANSVVTHDVLPMTVVAGVPARVLRSDHAAASLYHHRVPLARSVLP